MDLSNCKVEFYEHQVVRDPVSSQTMKQTQSKFLILPLVLLAAAGCRSGGATHYVSPEVTGRVLAADSHQPLANATVQRGGSSQAFEPFGPPKGGQQLIQPGPVRTDADGRFILESKSVFAPFRSPGWWSVTVAYSHSGYKTFQTNYTGDNVTSHTAAGAPVVNAGDVLLHRSASETTSVESKPVCN